MISRLWCCAVVVTLAACGKDRVTPALDAGVIPLPVNVCLDVDGDGFVGTGDCQGEGELDCNDQDPLVYPGALERCNGRDDSCEGDIDEGLPVIAYFADEDHDGIGSGAQIASSCGASPDGGVTQAGDCDDTNASIRPGQAELCNSVDDDCDGTVDNGLPFQDFYEDGDGDGFGSSSSTPVHSCETGVIGRVTNPADCNDADPTVKPGATELCNRVDDNCDGQVDNGIAYVAYYPDVDGDGFGDATAQSESTCTPVPGKVTNNSDCDDQHGTVKPGAPEVCNGLDDDCDAQTDEGLAFVDYYPDVDGDGFGNASAAAQSSCMPVAGRVTNRTDCNDMSAAVKPGAPEVCNAIDDNCSGAADEGLSFTNYYPDSDGDGFGATGSVPQSSCTAISGRSTNNTDCNDSNPSVKPGAPELCNAVDDNCNAQTDEGLTFTNYYPDGDGDGFGSASATAQNSCSVITGRVTNNSDCNDANAAINPSRAETCNQVDDNCNAQVDEGLTTTSYYPDVDGDGSGSSSAAPSAFCGPRAGFVTSRDDCNDMNPAVRPSAPEQCNGVDDNCDGMVDNGVSSQSYYVDSDGDGYGASGSMAQVSCSAVAGRVTNNLDCNDANAAVKPSAVELCNGVDDDCDSSVDEGLSFLSYYPDVDADGYGASGSVAQSACSAVAGKVTNNTDCNDTNTNVRPGATELCNGVDDDCAGGIDNGLPTQSYYTDADQDGFGSSSVAAQSSCGPVSGKVTNNTDCNDTNAAVRPNATEICNGIDDNCVSGIDENNAGGGAACTTGESGVCSTGTLTCQSGGLLCVRTTGPTTETCNGRDDNCNGQTDEGFANLGAACSAGLGACARNGTNVCATGGASVVCNVTAGAPTASACDGIDNDCDGVTDEPVLVATANIGSTAWTDVEVRPFFLTDAGCGGGANGTGSDAIAGGGVLMAGGDAGVYFQRLDSTGAPSGAVQQSTSLSYTDVDFAQAGDGFIVAGVWSYNNAEIDLYYVDKSGAQRALKYTQFKGASSPILDSLRVVRGNGKRVTLLWREAGAGIRMAQAEPCLSGSTWSIQAPGCTSTTLVGTTVVPSTTVGPGIGADSNIVDWTLSQGCVPASGLRRIAVAYLPNTTTLAYFTVQEDGTAKIADVTAYSVTTPRTLAEPDVTYFRDAASNDQYLVAYVTKNATSNNADLDYWLTNAQSWHYAWLEYATAAGVNSISRPRTSATAQGMWMSAMRSVNDGSGFARQVMTRTTDLIGNVVPDDSAVEVPTTTGNCGADPACRAGDKVGVTNWMPFNRLFYSSTGSTPVGVFNSTLTCN